MILDILLLVVIAGIIAVAAAEGFVRSLLMLFSFYLLSILLGMLIVALNIGQVLGDLVIANLAAGPTTPLFYQGIIFIGLMVPGFLLAVVLGHSALENASIRALGWGDNVLGTLVGLVIALVFAAVLCNCWGVIVREQWEPAETWWSMRVAFENATLRPPMMNILRTYRRLLFPFRSSGYPIFFVPQG